MSQLQESLESGQFTVTGEVGPPKGVDLAHCLEGAELMKDKVVAVNVTDIQTAVMRLSSVATCVKLLEHGVEPILQMVCRDRNRLALQSDALGAYALGIRNVVSITGDHILMGDHKGAMPVYDLDCVGLLQALSLLEQGTDLGCDMKGQPNKLEGPLPEFFKGCVTTPGADEIEPQVIKLEKKAEAGAQFCQTQAVYDVGQFETFMNEVDKRGIKTPVLVGIVVLKGGGMAKYMNRFVPGVQVPQEVVDEFDGLTDEADVKKKAAEVSAKIINACRKCCAGAHLMPLGWDDTIPMIVDQLD